MISDATYSQKVDWAAIMVVILGSFMAVLDSSIVNVALPKMMAVFGASQDGIEWILTGYMLTLGVIMPLSGYLGDTFGYKKVFMTALSVFVAGSALCGMAWSINSMIVARAIQALGGGLMQPLGMALLFKYSPREKMGMVMGIFGVSIMFAPAIGPCLGGYLVDYVNWRMIFYINVPIGILNFFLAMANLKETEIIRGRSLDKLGILFSSAGFFCLLLALSKAASKGWNSGLVIGLMVIGVISMILLVIVELRHPEPILDLRVFKNFVFTISCITTSLIAIGFFGAIFLIPMYIQNVLGFSAMVSGFITLSGAVASGIMMPIAGRIYDQIGARLVAVIGLAIAAYTTFMMHRFDLATPFAVMIFWFGFRGLGMGLCNMPISTAGMNTVPGPLIGKASALTNVIRQVSASFGVAVFTTILQHRAVFHFANLAQSISANSNEALTASRSLSVIAAKNGISSSTMQSIYFGVISKKLGLMAEASAIDDCFIIAAVLTVLALVLCFFLKENKAGQSNLSDSTGVVID